MLFFASLLGIAAIGASSFVGLSGGDDEPSTDMADDDAETADDNGPDLLSAALGLSEVGITVDDADNGSLEGETATEDADPDISANSEMQAPDAQGGWQIVDGGEETETITGTEAREMIGGRGGEDTITGGDGDDEIRGGDDADALHGDAGEDTIHGEDGNDTLYGEAGDDRLFGHNGEDTLWGGAGEDSLVGSAGNDTLHGGAGDDALHGDLDDDRIDGGMGSDTLFGGHGSDTLSGVVDDPATGRVDDIDSGRDYLNGGGGGDAIIAGRGDIVTTGSGADTVMLGDWLDGDHQAEILDFSVAQDMLMVFYHEGGPEPEITLEPDAANAADQRLLLDGVEVAHIANAAGLTLDHVALVPQAQMPVLPNT
jgi:Ca2+-binding RTX toxin-like protein